MIRRGEVRWAAIPHPDAPRRPVLVVSSDAFNASRLATVLAVVISSRPELADAPGNVAVPAAETGLPRDGVVNVAQIVTLDRRWIGDCTGRLGAARMRRVEHGLRLAAGLKAV